MVTFFIEFSRIFIGIVIVFSIYLIIKKKYAKNFQIWKEFALFLFVSYIIFVATVTLFPFNIPSSANNTGTYGGINISLDSFRFSSLKFALINILGNIGLFIPFVPLYKCNHFKGSDNNKLLVFLVLSLTVFIEIVQISLTRFGIYGPSNFRMFDIADILFNFLGGCLGFVVYHLYLKFVSK